MIKDGLMQDYAFRNSVLTLIVGFIVGGLLAVTGLPDPGPAVAVVVTWVATLMIVLYATVKDL